MQRSLGSLFGLVTQKVEELGGGLCVEVVVMTGISDGVYMEGG